MAQPGDWPGAIPRRHKRVVLAAALRGDADPRPHDFAVEEAPTAQPVAGQALVKVLYVAVDAIELSRRPRRR